MGRCSPPKLGPTGKNDFLCTFSRFNWSLFEIYFSYALQKPSFITPFGKALVLYQSKFCFTRQQNENWFIIIKYTIAFKFCEKLGAQLLIEIKIYLGWFSQCIPLVTAITMGDNSQFHLNQLLHMSMLRSRSL